MTVVEVTQRIAHIGLLVAAACALIACAMGPQKSDAQRAADRETVERVQAALDADKRLYAKHIFVRADNGVVRLTGYVWDPPDLDEARQVAEGVTGVTQVVNNLELQRNGSESGVVR
ncbi:MAG TPA: BON domain-containing protein [Burkholderiaceae bacterium]|nr:BON domain-containing protein [Burkholderiaceae bacterium]